MTADEILLDVEERMEKAVDVVKKALGGIRTGRANPGLVDTLLPLLLAQEPHWRDERQTLLHMDFSPANAAIGSREGLEVRLIDWHIAAHGLAAFDVAAFFHQPHHNHVDLDRLETWQEYLRQRYEVDGRRVDREEARALFCYALAFTALSFLPPIARARAEQGALAGWWGNTLEAIVDNLTWCAGGMRR